MNIRLPLHILSAATVLLFAATACTQDDLGGGTLPEGEYPLVIRATGLQAVATPASRATVDGDWQGVQTVALSVGGTVKEYDVTASDADGYQSATLGSDTDPFWWTSREDITVSAWWPYGTTMPDVVVKADQSTREGFEGSDFISAEAQTVQFDNPTLKFSHRTARVTINLKPGTGITSVDGATVSLTSLSADNENPTVIKTYNASGDTYEALTAPQTVAKGEPFIRVELGGGNFYFRPQSDVVLAAGSRYIYTVNVNATGLTLAGCEIGKWDDGGGENGEAGLSYIYDKETNTYTVYTADGLLAWNEAAQKDMTLNCTLADNITLPAVAEGESNWTPIGTESQPYTGTFDGNNYTITGLKIDKSETDYVGLIGCIGSDGTVKNVKLENVNITGDGYFVGGVAGTNYGTIENCSVDGTLTNNRHYLGGVVGNNYGSIIGCSSSGTITGTSPNVGGIGGQSVGGTIMACYSVANIKGRSSSGGVLGQTNRETVVIACYHAKGNVTGEQSRMIGGVIGWNYGKVTACYWENNQGQGIGDNQGSTTIETTKVDGTDVTWQTAVAAMNAALQNAGSEWRYKLTGELPTLKKEE